MGPNTWNVIWYRENKKYIKGPFVGDKPSESGALAFAKKLKGKGIPVSNIHIVSRRKTFAPPPDKLKAPDPGMTWCPYCLKWREFVEKAIRKDGLLGPVDWRCPICTVSIHDYYIRMYNPAMIIRYEARKTKVPSEKMLKRALFQR